MALWSRFDPTNLDLTNLDLTKVDLTKIDLTKIDLAELAKDATYIAVGATLLTVQRAQVRRREVARMLRR